MKKTVVMSLVGVVVVMVAVTYLFMDSDDASDQASVESLDTASNATPTAKKVLSGPISGKGSLQELLAKAEDLECSISYETTTGVFVDGVAKEEPVTGTYFTSRGMMRGDFVLPEATAGSVSSIILRDSMMYNWSEIDGVKYGMKYNMAAMAEAKSTAGTPEVKGPVPVDQPVTYDCKPWVSVDASIFEPPTDVLFRDVADMMNINMEYGTSYE